jgi:hypothetical protein
VDDILRRLAAELNFDKQAGCEQGGPTAGLKRDRKQERADVVVVG